MRTLRWIRSFLLFSLFIFCAVTAQRFCRSATDGFTIHNITSKLPHNTAWDLPPLSSEEQSLLHSILCQKFTYLSKGAQCYVFESADHRWVIKFFRLSHLMPPAWLQLLPPLFDPWRSNKVQKKGAKLFKDFSSYTLAYQELKEQTGLLYLHLNKTDHLKHSLTLEGPLHIEHTVDLDRMEFFVQRKADLVYPALESWVARGEVERAKSALSSLITLLKLRLDKGIFDKDPDLNTNFGFLGTSAIQIDVGRFKRKLSPLSSSERLDALTHITANLKQKLDRCAPELSSFLMQKILEEEGG